RGVSPLASPEPAVSQSARRCGLPAAVGRQRHLHALARGPRRLEHDARQEDPFFKESVDDSVRPVISDGLAKLVDEKERITEEVWLESTPGHTPGHFSVRISSNGQNAIITGDMMHHPIQCLYPEWDDVFDNDGPLAKKTRRAFCERYADTGTLVLGTHFATPSAGKIVKHDGAFRLVLA